jgi:hypothetical protein
VDGLNGASRASATRAFGGGPEGSAFLGNTVYSNLWSTTSSLQQRFVSRDAERSFWFLSRGRMCRVIRVGFWTHRSGGILKKKHRRLSSSDVSHFLRKRNPIVSIPQYSLSLGNIFQTIGIDKQDDHAHRGNVVHEQAAVVCVDRRFVSHLQCYGDSFRLVEKIRKIMTLKARNT